MVCIAGRSLPQTYGDVKKLPGKRLRPSGPASWRSATVSVAPVGVSPTESESHVVRPVLNVLRTSLMFEACNPPIQASGKAELSQPAAPKAHRAHSDRFGTRPCQISHAERFDNSLSLNDRPDTAHLRPLRSVFIPH